MWEKESDLSKSMFGWLVAFIAVGSFAALFAMVSPSAEQARPAVYLVKESYANYVVDGRTTVFFGIENQSPSRENYSVEFYFDGKLVAQKNYSLEARESKEFKEIIQLVSGEITQPRILKLVLVKENKSLATAFYWLKPKQ